MRKVAVVGAGKIGSTVVDLLAGSGAYEVKVIDASPQALGGLNPNTPVEIQAMAID